MVTQILGIPKEILNLLVQAKATPIAVSAVMVYMSLGIISGSQSFSDQMKTFYQWIARIFACLSVVAALIWFVDQLKLLMSKSRPPARKPNA